MTTPPLARSPQQSPTGADTQPELIVIEELETEIVPVLDEDRPLIDDLVALARVERELQRAAERQRYAMIAIDVDVAPWFSRPWARLAAAAVLGYAMGRSRALRLIAALGFGAALAAAVDRALAHTGPVPAHA
ncbi:MAG TPA: hypothetical protein VHE35_36600 [Kofleriaceae bacterium]|nr:hypothetical protein [Kofleriaceae bacterium]